MPPMAAARPWRSSLNRCAALAVLSALAACGKVQEVAGEKAAEKMIESAISKDGGTAKVDLGGGTGTIKAEGVDKDGKAYKIEMGKADVSDKDIGVAFYPGAKAENGSRIANGDTQMVQVELVSDDGVSKVADWYRAQLKPRMTGAQSMDQSTPDGALMTLSDEAGNDSLMVSVAKSGDNGSRVSLMHSTKTH